MPTFTRVVRNPSRRFGERVRQVLVAQSTDRHRIIWQLTLAIGFCFVWVGQVTGQRTRPSQQDMQAIIDASAETPLPTDPATVVAVVGNTPLLFGEIKPQIDAQMKRTMGKVNQEVPEDQIRFARLRLTRGLLSRTIQTRMMREAFLLDQVATQAADKRREADQTMQAKARQLFFETEIPDLMKRFDVKTTTDLDEKLRSEGTSLRFKETEFVDGMLGHLYLKSKVNQDPAISLSEILQYYQAHREDFSRKSQAKWEQLSVQYANFPDRDAAYRTIWEMGREAFFGGNMQAVARQKSQDPFADSGGLHDWTNRGSLASEILENEIFTLPLGKMSQIIEAEDGYHIVRVLDRTEAGVRPLADVQDEIRDIIKQEKIAQAQKDVFTEVRRRVPVWSLYPDDIPDCKPLSMPASEVASLPSATKQ